MKLIHSPSCPSVTLNSQTASRISKRNPPGLKRLQSVSRVTQTHPCSIAIAACCASPTIFPRACPTSGNCRKTEQWRAFGVKKRHPETNRSPLFGITHGLAQSFCYQITERLPIFSSLCFGHVEYFVVDFQTRSHSRNIFMPRLCVDEIHEALSQSRSPFGRR